MFEHNPNAAIVFDEETRRIESINRAAKILFNYREEIFRTLTLSDIIDTDPPRLCDAELRREIRAFRTMAGAVFTSEIAEGKFVFNGQSKILWIVREMDNQSDVEALLRERKVQEYRSLVENIAIGVTLIGRDMRILTLNRQMRCWYPRIDFSRQPLCYQAFNDPPGEKICTYCPVIQTLRDGRVHEAVAEIPSERSVRYFRIVASPVVDKEGNIRAAIEMVEDISEQRAAERQIRTLSQQLLTAQENERLMISNELHDSVAQDLSTMKISLALTLGESSTLPDDVRKTLTDMSSILSRTIRTVRNLSYDLRPPGLKEIGLIETLGSYCDEFAEDAGIHAEFHSTGLKNRAMNPFLEINIYRLVQEGLNNIRKHAEARRAVIFLIGAYPNVILRIEDDGKGFDVAAREQAGFSEKRMGLSSMRERVNLLMGKMSIRSRPGEGTRIFIRFPFRDGLSDLSEI
ncbi:histidine kinase [Desulfococcus sp.]|uniref:histidine kinase n=1 Tax=Desulfococcus sp. TaxID=2025834 RepID=UPI003D0A7B62